MECSKIKDNTQSNFTDLHSTNNIITSFIKNQNMQGLISIYLTPKELTNYIDAVYKKTAQNKYTQYKMEKLLQAIESLKKAIFEQVDKNRLDALEIISNFIKLKIAYQTGYSNSIILIEKTLNKQIEKASQSTLEILASVWIDRELLDLIINNHKEIEEFLLLEILLNDKMPEELKTEYKEKLIGNFNQYEKEKKEVLINQILSKKNNDHLITMANHDLPFDILFQIAKKYKNNFTVMNNLIKNKIIYQKNHRQILYLLLNKADILTRSSIMFSEYLPEDIQLEIALSKNENLIYWLAQNQKITSTCQNILMKKINQIEDMDILLSMNSNLTHKNKISIITFYSKNNSELLELLALNSGLTHDEQQFMMNFIEMSNLKKSLKNSIFEKLAENESLSNATQKRLLELNNNEVNMSLAGNKNLSSECHEKLKSKNDHSINIIFDIKKSNQKTEDQIDNKQLINENKELSFNDMVQLTAEDKTEILTKKLNTFLHPEILNLMIQNKHEILLHKKNRINNNELLDSLLHILNNEMQKIKKNIKTF